MTAAARRAAQAADRLAVARDAGAVYAAVQDLTDALAAVQAAWPFAAAADRAVAAAWLRRCGCRLARLTAAAGLAGEGGDRVG